MGRRERGGRGADALSGLLAATAGMAAGHLVAAFADASASPVLVVGSTVIDATPTPVKEWAVRTLGTHDKAVLVGGVAVVTLMAAAGIGTLARRHPRRAGALLMLLVALAGAAALARPGASAGAVLPAAVAAVVALVTLLGLRRLVVDGGVPDVGSDPTRPARRAESPLDHTAYAAGRPGRAPRRAFLAGAAGVGLATTGAAVLGQRLSEAGSLPASFTLPRPEDPLAALPPGVETQVPGTSPLRTPVRDFYRVDTALVVPRVDVGSWRLRVDGMVDRPFVLTYEQLVAMPMVERDITLNCVSNEVGGPYVGSTRWLGVPVRDLLARAGVQPRADQVLSTSTDAMTISTPVSALTDDRDALVAVAMDGRPLPAVHGFPARLVTPGLYGYVGATKWLTRLTATTYAAQRAYWTRRGWATQAPVRTQARIDVPRGLGTQPVGRGVIAGVAWSQAGGGIERVEVRVDDGRWVPATLGPAVGPAYWRQWHVAWTATKGRHDLTVRATDGKGARQTTAAADPFPSGASGLHSIVVFAA